MRTTSAASRRRASDAWHRQPRRHDVARGLALGGHPIAAAAEDQVARQAGGRRVAIVIAFASHGDPSLGDDLSRLATGQLTSGPFTGATIKTYHSIVAGDRGTTLDLEIYVYR